MDRQTYVDRQTNVDKAISVGNYLNLYFGQNQGIRLGDSVVVSRKAHAKMPEKRLKGQIKILLNRDAGKTYLDFVESDQVVHIDIYHKPGEINPCDVAKAVFKAVDQYFLEKDPQLQYAEDERFKIVAGYANKIFISTNQGKGTVYDLFQNIMQPISEDEEGRDHIHMLARLNQEEYYLIYVITEAAEEVVLASGAKLAKVRNIVHGNQKQAEESFAGYIKIPWKSFKGQGATPLPAKENVNQLVLKLAEKFGGVHEIDEFLESYSTNIFKRKGIEQQKKKWGDVEHYVQQLEELDLIKNTLVGKILTKKGMQLKEFIINHKCEIESEIRRNIRKVPSGGMSGFRKLGKVEKKASCVKLTNRNKTINNLDNTWAGDLAVPETIIQARKNCFLRNDDHFTVRRKDLHYYDKKSYIPVDICLLVDASGSMAGDKRQAACYLAEHLVLTGKEKVAVVTFQERDSKVVVPFTRNHQTLSKGLATITPAGLTPLAQGIVAAVNLIKSSNVRNPMLVLITDGLPNVPLWSVDAKADALEAATYIAKNNIRLIGIGVESNKSFLEKLMDKGEGVLYLVDDLNRDNLINIVRHEKKNILQTAKMA